MLILVLVLSLLGSVYSSLSYSQDQPVKLNLAVADFAGKNVSAVEASIISDFIRTRLVDSDIFNVMDRTNMELILKEHKFQLSGCTDQQCAVELGKLLNMQKILIGSVSKLVDIYYIDVSIVDIETGKIEISKNEECSDAKNLKPTAENLAIKLVRSYAKGEKMGLADSTPRIKSMSGNVILIDKGKNDGIKKRNIYYIIDDESQIKIGMLRVTEVREKESSAKLIKMLSGYYKTKISPGMPLDYYTRRKVWGIGGGADINGDSKFPFATIDYYEEESGLGINTSFTSAYRENSIMHFPYYDYWRDTLDFTLLLKYHFLYDSPVSFYVGAGMSLGNRYYRRRDSTLGRLFEARTNLLSSTLNFGVILFANQLFHLFLDTKIYLEDSFLGNNYSFEVIGVGASMNW